MGSHTNEAVGTMLHRFVVVERVCSSEHRLQSITNLTGFPVQCASLPPAWQVERSWINDQARQG